MTRRGRSVLALGFVVYLVAWIFGSRPLYPVAIGLLVVSALSWLVVRLATGPFAVQRRISGSELYEGDDVHMRVELEPVRSFPPPGTVELVERIGRLGEHRESLHRVGRRLRIDYVLPRVPRGRYAFENVHVELSDPFGLQSAAVPLPAPGSLLVYPRLVRLERLFSDAGLNANEGRRALLQRPTGFDFHSVREHEQGESLRYVHWRSTARRGRLMVRKLEDEPRDEVAVLLDANAHAVCGESFDVQVRAAGSILDACLRQGRRAVLVANAARLAVQQVHSAATDTRLALELLACVEPDGHTPLESLFTDEANPAMRALELAVVTARLDPATVDHLVQRALSRRHVGLVYVDPATFAGATPRPEPALLRLQAAGIAVAVVRAGDDLRSCLEGSPAPKVAARG